MTRDEIIRMAQQVSGVEFPINISGVQIGMSGDHLERFAALVAAAERESVCGLLERLADYYESKDRQGSAEDMRTLVKYIRTGSRD